MINVIVNSSQIPEGPAAFNTMNLQTIQLIAYDFDGVMTDNTVMVNQDGIESVRVHRGDGWAISQIKKQNISQIIISTEKNPVVSKRAEKLGLPCIQGCDDKKSALTDYCNENDKIGRAHV